MEKAKILIVEDEAIFAMELESQLQSLRYEVTSVVDNGEKAIQKVGEDKPDLVMMDIHLNGLLDGIATASAISRVQSIPIIFMTAYDDDTMIERAKSVLSKSFLFKPVKTQNLKASIEMSLHLHQLDLLRQKAENTLRESEARWKSLAENSPDHILELDRELKIQYVNHVSNGNDKEWVIGTPYCTNAGDEKQQIKVRKILEQILKTGHSAVYETNDCFENGKTHIYESHAAAIRQLENNQVSGIIVSSRDISDRIEAEQEKKKLEKMLWQSQKMEAIGTLTGGISHDFNNILHPILGLSSLGMRASGQNEIIQNYFFIINRAASRAKELIKQILTFSRKNNNDFKPIEIQPVIKETIRMLRSSLPTIINLEFTISESCPLVNANATQMHQVILNLITNAYQAMEKTGGTIDISLVPTYLKSTINIPNPLPPGDYVQLTVSDNGPGIPADAIEKVFEPYFTTKGLQKGTGLGLAVVFGIIKSHGGGIKVESHPGKGTSFKVYLPVSTEKPDIDDSKAQFKSIQGHERILVVDDEADIVFFCSESLKQVGYQVVGYTQCQEALQVFKMNPTSFDLVVTDMTMPGMSGFQMASAFLEIRPDIPIIICTGNCESVDKEKARALGIRSLLQKPINQDELATAIRSILDEEV